MRVPGAETIDLKRRKRVATIEQSQQRVATEHHSRQRNPRKNYPNAQTSHVDSLSYPSFLLTGVCPQYYDNRCCQKRLFCLPIVRNTREFPLTEVMGWPCLDAALICDAMGALESLWR